MRPSTLILAISATVLTLPLPLPVLDDITDKLVDTVDNLLGIHHYHKSHNGGREHEPECRRYDAAALTACMNA
ncbi:hypothetical protein F4774DRAFT_383293 [Daldinia eschscholtzii]|nr:hypothetical protein F4774DRAFT_383293 [Daldinia eschscholtzii]